MISLKRHLVGYWLRVLALLDKSALLLMAPALLVLYVIDAPMFKTITQWIVVAPVLAGIAVMVSRVIYLKINLTDLVRRSQAGNVAAAIVAAAVILSVSLLFMALILWSKA